jgi:hypothetical protein
MKRSQIRWALAGLLTLDLEGIATVGLEEVLDFSCMAAAKTPGNFQIVITF